MAKRYSIAEARSKLPTLIDEIERGDAVEITRRGQPVAVVLSTAEYRRMASGRPTFRDAYAAWKRSVEGEDATVEREHFTSLRDRSPGRRVKL